MGLPSSGLLQPGQIQILLPHSSRICGPHKHDKKNKSVEPGQPHQSNRVDGEHGDGLYLTSF